MSEPKFTPGRWAPYFAGPDDTWVISQGAIAKIASRGTATDTEELDANAHLISAAPDLYEALEQILDDMGEDGLCVCPAAKRLAQAALAKAEGRT